MRPLILIVEDEVDAGDVLSLVLEEWGYNTVVAHDGLEGLFLAQSMSPKLILCDYNLPRIDGEKLALELAGIAQTKTIPFVLMSAKYETLNPSSIFSAALKKPLDLKALKDVIEKLVVTAELEITKLRVDRTVSSRLD